MMLKLLSRLASFKKLDNYLTVMAKLQLWLQTYGGKIWDQTPFSMEKPSIKQKICKTIIAKQNNLLVDYFRKLLIN